MKPSAKNWIQTYTGKKFFPLHPRKKDLSIRDQARALSMCCRYAGHVDRFYSVAEHAVRLRWQALDRGYPIEIQKWALIHDNAEAYLGDMTRPVKRQPEMQLYRDAEERLKRMIAKWLGLPKREPKIVTALDTEILGTEARALKSPIHPDWGKTTATGKLPDSWYLDESVLGWSPKEAEICYLEEFRELWSNYADFY